MIDWLFICNTLVQLGIVVGACIAAFARDRFTSIFALGACGAFMGLEFLILHAPDVAIAEVSVGAVLSTTLFIIALRRIRKKEEKQ